MRTSYAILVATMCLLLGFAIGAGVQGQHDINNIEQAWDGITVVKDGTLVANPSAYAYHPEDLAKAKSVRIIDNRTAAIAAAMNEAY